MAPGIIGVVVGLVLVIIGLSPDLSCGLIHALGGQCIVLLGNLAAQGPYGSVPTASLGVGAFLAIVGGISAYMASTN